MTDVKTAPEEKSLMVIDVMPLLYRGHFVFLRNPRMTTAGVNTSALYGFAGTVLQVLEQQSPTHVALVLDSRTPTFRHLEYPEYKAQRQKMPEDIATAIPLAEELAAALRLPILRLDGFEADDLMGALATRAAQAGMRVCLVTPDKDVAQLVDDRVSLCRPGKGPAGAPEILGVAEVCQHWGLSSPAQMVDYLALLGDASDNIPGVDGVGEKTALSLVQTYGSLENVIAHAAELKGKLAERLATGAESARLSYHLATICRNVPMELDLESLKRQEPDTDTLRNFLARYEMAQVARRLLGSDDRKAAATEQHETYCTLRESPHNYTCVRTEAELSELLAELAASPQWAFDTETTGLDAWQVRLVGMSFAITPGRAWYVPVPADANASQALLGRFRPLFENPAITKIGHNLKYDITIMRCHGVRVGGTLHDSMLAHYVYDAADRHGMDHLARQFLGYDPIPITQLIGEKGAEQKNMADLAPEQISDYAAEDADVTLQLYHKLQPQVVAGGGRRALEDCEEPLVRVLVDMEEEGVRIDPAVLKEYAHELDRELLDFELKIREFAGGSSINLASPKQMGELLFDQLKLDPDAKRTASGQYATDEDTLQKLAGKHPIVDLILEHRACSKLKSTYVDKLPESIRASTGRIHTSFSQALTETGRLSSSNPNLQNIPIRTDRGRRIRAAFVARDDKHLLLSADYSQIELRVMAALSGDAAMREAFQRGADIHTETAARVYGVMPALVSPEQRSRCKMVNFGIIYGISAFGLAQRLRIPRQQAAALIETYFAQYPGVKAYMDRAITDAREKGYAQTLLGRRRFLRDITSRNGTVRQAAERNAINTPVQGSAADLIKLAMVSIQHALQSRKLGTKMVLQVHDELLFDMPREEEAEVREIVRHAMVNAMKLDVPLDVEIGSGATWLDAH